MLIDSAGGSSGAQSLASSAKCLATDAAMAITTDRVELPGGAGYLRKCLPGGLTRDAKMLQLVEGTNQIRRSIIVRELLKKFAN